MSHYFYRQTRRLKMNWRNYPTESHSALYNWEQPSPPRLQSQVRTVRVPVATQSLLHANYWRTKQKQDLWKSQRSVISPHSNPGSWEFWSSILQWPLPKKAQPHPNIINSKLETSIPPIRLGKLTLPRSLDFCRVMTFKRAFIRSQPANHF